MKYLHQQKATNSGLDLISDVSVTGHALLQTVCPVDPVSLCYIVNGTFLIQSWGRQQSLCRLFPGRWEILTGLLSLSSTSSSGFGTTL